MNRNGIRIAACALAGTIAFSGYHTSIYAKANLTSVLPAAGIAVVLEEGTTIQELTQEVIENIAYLESASGLQPNILIAAEQVPLAENAEDYLKAVVEEKSTDEENKQNTDIPAPYTYNVTEFMTGFVNESKADNTKDNTSKTVDNNSEGQSEVDSKTETTQEHSEESSKETTQEHSEESSEESAQEHSEESSEESAQEHSEESSLDHSEESSTEQSEEDNDKKEAESVSEEETEGSLVADEQKEDYTGLVIAKVDKYVNVRSIPSEDGEIVGKLYDKSVGDFIEEVDGWYKITSGECTGYVKGLYCVTGDEAQELAEEVGTTYAVVDVNLLNVRKEANTDSTILGKVPMAEELVVVEELDEWVKVAIEEGDGYVSKEFVQLKTEFVHAESKAEETKRLAEEKKAREEAIKAAQEKEQAEREKAAQEAAKAEQQQAQEAANAEQQQAQETEVAEITQAQPAAETVVAEQEPVAAAPSSSSEIGNAVINYATQFVGNPYVYGGTSLTNGTDCSGFVMRVYENFGVNLPHSSSAMRSKGYDVGGLENAQPGDIVCYSGHVGLYVGDGQIVHASTSRTGIIVSNANYRQILTVRRIF